MADRPLVAALKRQLAEVEADLRARSEDPDLAWAQALRAEYAAARERGRTALAWSVWRDGEVALSGVAWVLAAVFVRFVEDNRLVDRVWIAGAGDRMSDAVDAETAFYAADPSRNSRDWLRDAFAALTEYPATQGLVDPAHNQVWTAPLGADMCDAILKFWRQQDADGQLEWSLADSDWDTRFLGDLYQDLSVFAKKKYALLQTPDFVEEFILDRTLTPALAEVPLAELKMIDPTCGSGHFLLGGFARILDAWLLEAPAMDVRERVQKALDAVNGVDINPFAVAIARFRLTLAALHACGVTRLADAPGFRLRIAVGDSLLVARGELVRSQGTLDFDDGVDDGPAGFLYAAEDVNDYPDILAARRYHVVVGNPPYITVKDPALNEAYRRGYDMCKGKYALSVPFMELFFDLAVRGNGRTAGWVGQITSNSFMKREFGSKLIEDMLSGVDPLNPVDLVDVIDTSGAYLAGFGTPTVILIGRRRRPVGDTVHAVLGVRGEPGQPDDPRTGLVWSEISHHINDPDGFDGSYVTITDLSRDTLAHHPWSLSGGGAGDLKLHIDASGFEPLASRIAGGIGFASFPGADEVFFASRNALVRSGVPDEAIRAVVAGDVVRDFQVDRPGFSLVPYDLRAHLVPLPTSGWLQRQWPFRTVLEQVTGFGGVTRKEAGESWWAWYRWVGERYRTPLSITFAEVATHNHFVLDRGGKVFKQTAPVIKLPADATVEDHLGLVGVLNSSTAAFWLKQVCHNKGSTVDTRGARQTQAPWEDFFQFNATKVQGFPLPPVLPLEWGRRLDDLARQSAELLAAAVLASGLPTRDRLDSAHAAYDALRRQMIAAQEELDWQTYRLYGLLEEDLTVAGQMSEESSEGLPEVALGERAFEIALARRVAEGSEETAWFTRHDSTPTTAIPDRFPSAYRELLQRRLDVIESNPSIRLLERPEFKRRWAGESWESMERTALVDYVLDRLEDPALWSGPSGPSGPRVLSVAQVADAVRHDAEIRAALVLLYGADVDTVKALTALTAEEAVPYLAASRYKPSGMVKRAEWEAVWELQRREDAGESVDIPVPPKYAQADFRKPSYWQARGKLDVPKERFISYPGAGRDTDPTPLLGWAGWDHGERAEALAGLIVDRADVDGWGAERLTPLFAGLVEVEPWLRQWHSEIDPEYGTSTADDITALLDQRLNVAALTRADVAAWRPPTPTRGRHG